MLESGTVDAQQNPQLTVISHRDFLGFILEVLSYPK